MKPIATRVAAASLLKKGFQLSKSDHEKYFFYYEGKKTSLWAKISFGSRELLQREVRGMARTLQLTTQQFTDLLECPMSETDFKRHAADKLKYLYQTINRH